MFKCKISVDETWPVFSLDSPKWDEEGPFIVDVPDDFYKEYVYFKLKYYEYQIRLQGIYGHAQRLVNEKITFRLTEGSECCGDVNLNKIRGNGVAQESLPAFLHEGNV